MTTKGKPAHRGKKVSEAELRRMWSDMSMSQIEIARRLGISAPSLRKRAALRGFPPRDKSRPWLVKLDHGRIVRLYRSGLSMHVIAKMLGCSQRSVRYALQKAEVPSRARHRNAPGALKPEAWIGRAMAASARETEAVLRLSEMVDGFRDPGKTRKAA